MATAALEEPTMLKLNIAHTNGWFFVTINGRADRFSYSTATAAGRRLLAIKDGWI